MLAFDVIYVIGVYTQQSSICDESWDEKGVYASRNWHTSASAQRAREEYKYHVSNELRI